MRGPVISECEPVLRAMQEDYLNARSIQSRPALRRTGQRLSSAPLTEPPMRAARLLPICLMPVLAACATLPAFGDRPEAAAAQAAWPALMPIDALLAAVPPAPAADPAAAVAARAAALRARAAALQQVDPAG